MAYTRDSGKQITARIAVGMVGGGLSVVLFVTGRLPCSRHTSAATAEQLKHYVSASVQQAENTVNP
ncbi:hypothetical protein [Comamonas sp. GB3 AK4-5]|uniref:hypothetical protein n=1 Tax=Comamonas sp. GB3 AK4-5 TaxID=3231487 RepID=UPI00351F5B79